MNLLIKAKSILNVNEYLDNLDFKEFNDYLDNYFIPKFITKVDQKDIIFLGNILPLDLSDNHFTYLMKYLESKNIIVIGTYRYLVGEFPNYIYKERIRNVPIEIISKKTLDEKFREYMLNKNDDLRNEIFFDSISFAKFIFDKYYAKYGFYFYDYLKVIYDSVNLSFDYYNPNKEVKYSTYLYNFLTHEFSKRIQLNLLGIVDTNIYNYLECIREIELLNGKRITDDLSLINDVIELLISKNIIVNNKSTIELTYNKILKILDVSLSLDDESLVGQLIKEENLIDPINYENEVINAELIDHIEEFLSCLSEREKYILKLYFGFYTASPLTQAEVAKIVNLSRERVRQIIMKSLEKIRKKISRNNCHLDNINFCSYAKK